jgi:hypothetical protein
MYRVLVAAGGKPGDTAQYRLEPWAPDNARTHHRGHWIARSSPFLEAIEAAERDRPFLAPRVGGRFEAEWA